MKKYMATVIFSLPLGTTLTDDTDLLSNGQIINVDVAYNFEAGEVVAYTDEMRLTLANDIVVEIIHIDEEASCLTMGISKGEDLSANLIKYREEIETAGKILFFLYDNMGYEDFDKELAIYASMISEINRHENYEALVLKRILSSLMWFRYYWLKSITTGSTRWRDPRQGHLQVCTEFYHGLLRGKRVTEM